MRVLVVSQFYPPEVGATQNRLGAFVDGLAERGHQVSVVCEQPNHPSGIFQPGYGRRPLQRERGPRATVHRVWVATSPRKTRARRLAFYGSFAAGAGTLVAALARSHDVVFASSPPLPGALAAGAAAKARRVPFVLDVRDLWSAAAEALGELSQPALVRMLERGETWLYRHAAAVTATTRPFCREIDAAAGRPVSVHLPNGALDELLARPVRPLPPGGTFTVGYVGNLGIAQGLSIVFDCAAALRGRDVRFLLVGDGPLAADLRARREREGLDNVELRGQVPTDRVGEVLDGCHALLVPLGAHAILEQFIPSKLYDAMAAGRAAIVAAGGEPAALVLRSGAGVAVPAEDGAALASAIRLLAADRDRVQRMGEAGRRVARRHARSAQNDRLEAVLLDASHRRSEAA